VAMTMTRMKRVPKEIFTGRFVTATGKMKKFPLFLYRYLVC
jgi:hypothetical protein